MSDRKRWTDSDIEFLRENHFKLTVPELAERLGITISSVTNKLKRLKLSYASSHDRLERAAKVITQEGKQQTKTQSPRKQSIQEPSTAVFEVSKAEIAHRAKAIEQYEKAVIQFHKIDKNRPQEPQRQKVKELFSEILTNYQSEIDICCKARSYYNYMISQEKPESVSKDIESKITEGIIYLQLDNIKEALKIFRSIAKTEPHNSYNLYCLACTYAKENDIKNAVKTLKDAVKFDPSLKFVAGNDKDLINLYDNQEFSKIINIKH